MTILLAYIICFITFENAFIRIYSAFIEMDFYNKLNCSWLRLYSQQIRLYKSR